MLLFDRPGALALLLLVPVLVYVRHFWRRRGGQISFPFSIWGADAQRVRGAAAGFVRALSTLCFWAGFVVLLIAFAGPQQVRRERVYITRGVDIMFVLDQSPTMAARDFRPDNRFEAARGVIRRFVDRRENDPIGLVGFGAEAALRVPPTVDYAYLRGELDRMHVLELGDGTAIGMGVAVAALHLERSTAPRRVIILLTDGINNAGEIEPETAARAVASLGIELYVIGIGTGEEVDLELIDPETGQVLRGTVSDGFDEEALTSLAQAAGGQYTYAGSTALLQSIFDQIDSNERLEQRSLLRVEREPLDGRLILIGLALVLVDIISRRSFAREVL